MISKLIIFLALICITTNYSFGSLLPHDITKTTVFIFNRDGNNEIPLGTGFIIGIPAKEISENAIIPYLVTAKHVIENKARILVRFNIKPDQIENNETTNNLIINLNNKKGKPIWYSHPKDDNVDVAIMRIPHIKTFDYLSFPYDLIATNDVIKSEDITEGDEVFFPSLLVNIFNLSRNYPVIRNGYIAALLSEKMKLKIKKNNKIINIEQNLILIEANSYPGASGSPVYLKQVPFSKPNVFKVRKPYLLGIVMGYLPANPQEILTIETDSKYFYRENSGIALVVPAEMLVQIINSKKFQDQLTDIISKAKNNSQKNPH